MADRITIYQKPTCSKCRATLDLLRESGKEFDSVNYYETPLTAGRLRELLDKLAMPARAILRVMSHWRAACSLRSGRFRTMN